MININQLFSVIIKIFLIVILAVTGCLIGSPVAYAHRPHDVIEQLEISPNYHQDKTIYIIVRDKFLKSEDGGKSWYRIFRGLDNTYDFSDLSISSQNEKILYIATPVDGVYRSEDSGLSWVKKNQGLEAAKITLLSVASQSPNVVLAADQEVGLYLTADGGNSWRRVMDNAQITTIAFAVNNDKIVAAGDQQGNIYLSSDQGITWQEIYKFDPVKKIQTIAFSPNFNQDKTFWVGTEEKGIFITTDSGNSFTKVTQGLSDNKIRDIVVSPNYPEDSSLFISTWNEGVFQSNDRGKSWKKLSQGLTKDSQADEDKFSVPHFEDLKISQNFQADQTLFLGGFDGLFTSKNGGTSWQELETLSTRAITSLAISPNYQNDATLAVGTYEKEAYISHDQGMTWQPMVRGFAIPSYRQDREPKIRIAYSRFYDLIFSPNYAQDNTLFATFLYKFFKSTNQGKLWRQVILPNPSGVSLRDTYMVASPNFADDGILYIVTKHGGAIYQSTDQGETFSVIHQLKHLTNNVVISPNFTQDQTLFVSGINRLYKTTDGGKNWQVITDDPALKDVFLLNLAISPNYENDQTVFGGTNQGIFQTTDGGQTWNKLNSPIINNREVEALEVSPNYQNDQTLMASIRGIGLVKSVDSGQTFQEVGHNFNQKYFIAEMVMSGSSPIRFSPNYANDQTIYGFGSTTANLYKSTDGGSNWEVISIPQKTDLIAKFITNLRITKILLNVYPLLKFLLALLVALCAYFFVGLLKLEKRLPLSRFQVQLGISLSLFVIVIMVLIVV